MKKLLVLPLVLLLTTCIKEKNPSPYAYTLGVTNLNANSADVVVSVSGLNINERGVCWSKTKDPLASGNHMKDNSVKGNFTLTVSGLDNNSTYFVRGYATNGSGTSYGDNISFTTPILPTVTAVAALSISQTSVSINCEYLQSPTFTINSLGLCWATTPNPTFANNKIVFSTQNLNSTPYNINITNLTPNVKYYVRAYASSGLATIYSNEINFITQKAIETGTVNDSQGNVYKTVTIGDQTWMAENLKVLNYRNGDAIYNATTPTNWSGTPIGAYCYYNNQVSNQTNLGVLYNFNAIKDPRGIAPTGWHVPNQQDWLNLIAYLGTTNPANKLKTNSPILWTSYLCTSNTFSFNAVPGGFRDPSGSDYNLFIETYFWSNSENSGNAYVVSLQNGACDVYTGFQNKGSGYSVRCVKD